MTTTAAIRSEWTKFWSVRSTGWGLAGAVVLMLVVVVPSATSLAYNRDTEESAAGLVAGGTFFLAQCAVIALASLFIAGEYATGSIRATLQWVPVRHRMLAAKASVLAPVLFVLGIVAAAVAIAVATPLMDGYGRPASAGEVIQACAGNGAYFALTGVLSLGIGTALRSVAVSITVSFLVMLMSAMVFGSLGLGVADYMPGVAGASALVASGQPNPVSGSVPPYPSWAGLLILAAWTAAALAVGHEVLRRRDA
ncbi:ABC transporter permease [Amycolatopsis endophytica]|uniref:ABC-2 type transport system permease protein n=1 Tax=Amycolatopsis endophytica TaxID=860233 RepID=A0A853AXF9_9PSEU|nr:ABC transporter permease subunit [Amycolatopsis endophytica]NYI87304.1 ABC-2 type transport system permease protein [Amycolatopsis endophytica]